MHHLYDIVRYALGRWGYLAVLVALLGESAGLPLPGETILIFASFLSHKGTSLHLQWVILVAIAASVIGDNLGFLMGRLLGRRLLRWIQETFNMEEDIAAAKDQIHCHGPATVFWARFIAGLRAIAGPVAGALGMEWKRFLLYNILGAVTWVTTIAVAGYIFAHEFRTLLDFVEKISWVIAGGIFAIGFVLWQRKKKNFRDNQAQKVS